MSKLTSLAAMAIVMILSAAPASAQDWIASIIAQQKAQSGAQDKPRSASRSAQRAARATETAAKPTRVARANTETDGDDGSRPQRRAATASRVRESLSGGSGETGVASYYWEPQALASGGRFNPDAMTAAHKTLPFGTRVRVTHLSNGNSVDVVINDRGPYVAGRIIDLSRRAAQNIGMTGSGVARVRVAVLGRG